MEAVMNFLRVKTCYIIVTSILLSTSLILGACAKKAKMVQAGAAQFEAQSLAAIEKIDELRRKETEVTPLPPEKASKFFVDSVKKSKGKITLNTLRILINPLKTEAPTSEAQWQAFLQKMRRQYTTFAATFASLDTGSLFAASDVKDTIPILDKLIAQIASFGKSIKDNPAEFIRERAAIAAEIEQVREAMPSSETTDKIADKITDLKLLELERRLREISAAEKQITREAIEQALKAATLGTELRKILANYENLSLDDIAEGLTIAFKLVAVIPGLDVSELKAQTDELIIDINKDEDLKTFFDIALSEINKARMDRR
jgi:hypothetical protein